MSSEKQVNEATSDPTEIAQGQLDLVTGGVVSEPPDPNKPVLSEPPDPSKVFKPRTL